MLTKIRIGRYFIGKGCGPFIIAEAGINHNGELKKAFAMIKAAKECGADAIKFQTFKAEEFISDHTQIFTYYSQGKKVTEPMFAMFKRCEFSASEWFRIKEKCDKEGILFLSTAQNRTDLDLLLKIGIRAIKVGSDDFTYTSLLKDYAKTGLPIILSCGMADLDEIKISLNAAGAFKGYPVILLYCISQYPAPAQDVNMLKLKTLRESFPGLTVGFSDHTQTDTAAVMAVAFGACVFEKHFTLDKGLPGPDHWFSENPQGLKSWVLAVRRAHTMLGSAEVVPTRSEQGMRIIARRSIVAARDIKKGEILALDNLALKRPGTGLPVSQLQKITGRRARRNIKNDTLIKRGDFI